MARGKSVEDLATLEMALVGYQIERQKIEDRIRDLRAQLKGRQPATPSVAAKKAPGTKRNLSAAARRRIGAAQRRRWKEHRKRLAQRAKGAA